MDSVFGSPKLNRKILNVNRRTGIKQSFSYDSNLGYKSDATPSIVTWQTRGKGVQGETINSTNNAARLIINRNWKPLQS
jgi:hypothetical protein